MRVRRKSETKEIRKWKHNIINLKTNNFLFWQRRHHDAEVLWWVSVRVGVGVGGEYEGGVGGEYQVGECECEGRGGGECEGECEGRGGSECEGECEGEGRDLGFESLMQPQEVGVAALDQPGLLHVPEGGGGMVMEMEIVKVIVMVIVIVMVMVSVMLMVRCDVDGEV